MRAFMIDPRNYETEKSSFMKKSFLKKHLRLNPMNWGTVWYVYSAITVAVFLCAVQYYIGERQFYVEANKKMKTELMNQSFGV